MEVSPHSRDFAAVPGSSVQDSFPPANRSSKGLSPGQAEGNPIWKKMLSSNRKFLVALIRNTVLEHTGPENPSTESTRALLKYIANPETLDTGGEGGNEERKGGRKNEKGFETFFFPPPDFFSFLFFFFSHLFSL